MDPVYGTLRIPDIFHNQPIISRDFSRGVGGFLLWPWPREFVGLASDQPGIAIRCHAYVKEMRAKGHEVGDPAGRVGPWGAGETS